MKILALIMIASVVLLGCATGKWVKDDEQPDDWGRDVKQCKYEVALGQQQSQSQFYSGVKGAVGTGLAQGLGDSYRWHQLMEL